MYLPETLRLKSVIANDIFCLTLDAFTPVAPQCFAHFLTPDFQQGLRRWHSAINHDIGLAEDAPTEENLAQLKLFLSPQSLPLITAYENWLLRGANHESNYSLGRLMDGLGEFHKMGTLPIDGLSDVGRRSLLELYETSYLPMEKLGYALAPQFEKEWSPYVVGDQYDYNCTIKSDWDRQMYERAYASEADIELSSEVQNMIEIHAARNFVDYALEILAPADLAALNAGFVPTLKFSGVFEGRPGRLRNFERSLKPLEAHALPNTTPIQSLPQSLES